MAGRCGCSSSNATGASITAGACATVTGAGTAASPAVIGVLVDPDAANNLQCGGSGLFAASAQVEVGDGLTISGDGSLATPYDIGVDLDPDAANLLTVGADGLLALPDTTYMTSGSFLGGSPPTTGLIFAIGQAVVTTDTSGNATITLPDAFPNGFLMAIVGLESVPTINVSLVVDSTAITLDSFRVNAKDSATFAAVSGGLLQVGYVAVGW